MEAGIMTADQTLAELERLLEAATPVRDGWNLRVKDDGEERYDLIGDPCGFPVATFGSHCDAALDLAARRALPRLLAERKALREALGEARQALQAIEDSAAETGFDVVADIIASVLVKANTVLDGPDHSNRAALADTSGDRGEGGR